MALFERHRGLWRGLRPAGGRRRRSDLGRNRQLALEVLELRVTPTTSTWSGALDGSWMNDGNWDVPPAAGNDLVFPAGAMNLSNTDDLSGQTSFASLSLASSTAAGGYTIGAATGSSIALTGPLDDSSPSAVTDSISVPIELDNSGAVSVDQSNATLVLQGALTGTSGLTLTGSGILDLEGPNTYSGTTNVNGGVLYVNTTQAGSPVTINSGATLGGTGTVGAITSNSGTVSPGTSTPGMLTAAGDLNLSSGSTFSVALDGLTPGTGYSQLTVSGTVTLDNATLDATALPMATGNNQFMIIDNTGSSPVSGIFAGHPEGTEVTISNQPYQISYKGGDGNDVVLTSLVNSTTTVASSVVSAAYGAPISLTATVMSADSSFTQVPTGEVTFSNGSTVLGMAQLNSSGVATLDNAPLPVGANNAITATYSGDTSFAASTSAAAPTVTVSPASTTTVVTSSLSGPVSGQSVTLTATISPASTGAMAPTGTVDFYSGTPTTGRLLGTGGVTGNVATLTTKELTTADTSLTAVYLGDGNYTTSTSPASAITVTMASTGTTVTIAPNPSGLGAPVVLTATVIATGNGSGVPTGTVEFMNGSTMLGTGTLNNSGVATLTTSSLAQGANTITAVYQGDSNFTTSTSPGVTATVSNASTTTASASPTAIVFGQSTTLTATVTPAVGTTPTPTGNVEFFNGTTGVGTVALSSGTAVLSTTTLPTGTLSITAQYQGDGNYAGSTSAAFTVDVAQATSSATVTVTPNPSGLGQSVSLKATIAAVSPGAGTPTGTVEFLNGSTSLGTASLSSGVASLSTTALTFGANSITAMYMGDTNFVATTSPAVTANVEQASTTTLVAAPTAAVTGQPVTLTATVAAVTSGTGTPTGTVTFMNGSTSLGTATLSSGTAVLTTMSLVVGTPSITAVYAGDSTFAGSTSPAASVTVTKANTTVAVNVVPSPSNSGATVTLTATVTAASPGTGTPTGSVTFFNGTNSLGSGTLLSNGTTSITSSALTAGSNSITATYAGDTNYNGMTSPVVTQTVLPATTTTVASSPSPSVVGQPVTLTAGVSSTAGVPGGTVQFLNGTTVLGTATLSGGVASFVTSALPFGFDSITAAYQGSSSFSPSTSSAITQTVQQASTTTTLTSSKNPASLGQSVTFTATVHPAPPSTGGPTPTGSITFMDGTTSLGSGTLTNGVATFTTSTLTAGTHSISTVYVNDGNYSSSTSPVLSQVISMPGPTVTLAITTGNPVSNQAVVLTVVVAPVSPATATPTGTVNFLSNGTVIGSGTLTNGSATLTFSSFALGNQTIVAAYTGDTNFAATTSNSIAIKVGDGNQLFVNQLYLQLLDTIADPLGLANYATLLANGSSRSFVVHSVAFHSGLLKASSLEKAVLGESIPRSRATLVKSLYQKTLGRQPSGKELKSGIRQVGSHGGADTLVIKLLSSQEYFHAAFVKGSTGALANPTSAGVGQLSSSPPSS